MIIVGAKGFAKEVLEIMHQLQDLNEVVFYDDVSDHLPEKIYNQFSTIKSIEELTSYLQTSTDKRFTLGLGNPQIRYKLYKKIEALGATFSSTISPFARIGHFDVQIGAGTNLMTGTVLTNSISLGIGCLINLNCTIGHDCTLGEFVELSPGVHVSGNCSIGSFTNIGTNATLLPKVNVGKNVIIGAGAVVTKDIPDNSLAVGIPAKVIKQLPPFNEH